MVRSEIVEMLSGFIRGFRIDPHDAGLILERCGRDGVDAETLGDYLDGAGYPELALVAYGGAA